MMLKTNNKIYFKFFIIILLFIFFSVKTAAEQSTITFKADKVSAVIAENKKATNLVGNAVVTVDTLKISADIVEIFGTDYRYVNASGAVTGEDIEKGYTFKADLIKFDRKTDSVLMFGKIELTDTKNNVRITTENMEYKKKQEIMIMRFTVTIVRKDINCSSMFALYNRKESTLELTGRPLVKKGNDEFRAGKISVNLDSEDIKLDRNVSGTVKESKSIQKNQNTEISDKQTNQKLEENKLNSQSNNKSNDSTKEETNKKPKIDSEPK